MHEKWLTLTQLPREISTHIPHLHVFFCPAGQVDGCQDPAQTKREREKFNVFVRGWFVGYKWENMINEIPDLAQNPSALVSWAFAGSAAATRHLQSGIFISCTTLHSIKDRFIWTIGNLARRVYVLRAHPCAVWRTDSTYGSIFHRWVSGTGFSWVVGCLRTTKHPIETVSKYVSCVASSGMLV